MDYLTLTFIGLKFTLYLGIFFTSGTVFYSIFFETNESKSSFNARRTIFYFGMVGLISALANYLVYGLEVAGDFGNFLDPTIHTFLWSTSFGKTFLIQSIGFLLIFAGFSQRSFSKGVMSIGCFIVLASFTQFGHISVLNPFPFQILLFVHLVCISTWVGILPPLLKLSSDLGDYEMLGIIAHRFGRVAVFFVPVLLIAGVILAYRLVGSLDNLLNTNYGQILLTKVLFTSGLLLLAALNKLRFTPLIRKGNPSTTRQLNYSVLGEIGVICIILMTTAVLTNGPIVPSMN